MRSVTFTMDIPEDLEERLMALGEVEWGHTGPLDDKEHLAHLTSSLRLTREHFGSEGPQDMHGVYLAGTETVVCHNGTSPNSPMHARLIVGLFNALSAAILKARAA